MQAVSGLHLAAIKHFVQAMQQEPVAANHDDRFGIGGIDPIV